MVSDQLIHELQVIISEEYGKDLPFNEVAEIASGLVNYFSTLQLMSKR